MSRLPSGCWGAARGALRLPCPLRLLGVLVLLLAAACARSETLFMPVPLFIERQLSQSSTVFLEVQGEQRDLTVQALLQSSSADLERLRLFLRAITDGNAEPLNGVAGAAFARSPDGLAGYVRRFATNWKTLADQRLVATLRFAGLEMYVFAATLRQQRIYPTVYFRRDEAGTFRLIPDEASNNFQILALWSASLRSNGLNLLTEAAARNQLVRVVSPDGAAQPGATSQRPALWIRRAQETTAERAAPAFDQFRRWGEEAGRLAASAAAVSAELDSFLNRAFTPDSAQYVRSMPADERQQFLKNFSASAAVGYLDLGSAVALLIRHAPTDGVHVAFLTGPAQARRLANLGKASPLDSFLLGARAIPRPAGR